MDLKVSFYYLSGIYAIVLVDAEGTLAECKVASFDSEINEELPIYRNITLCKHALVLAKAFIDKHPEYESMSVETSVASLVNRINRGWSSECTDEFLELFKVLDSIPVMYSFRVSSHLLAKKYARKRYLPKETMLSLSEFDDIEDEM